MMETENKEFKEKWTDDSLKTICAFANTFGGELIIGISDKGEIVGVKDIEKLIRDLPNKIRDKLKITPSISVEEKEGRKILHIKIFPSSIPVSYEGKFYVRSGSPTQELKDTELAYFLLEKMGKTWDSLSSGFDISDIDFSTIEMFKNLAKNRIPSIKEFDSVEKIFLNLKLFDENEKITNAGILLFGKEPQKRFISATVRVGRFKNSTHIVDTVVIEGNLFKQVEEVMNAIKKHLNVRFEIKGVARQDVWDYPLGALREAVINALIHRDYLSPAEIQIKIYDDRIWIWNPGKLPPQIKLEELKKEHSSYPRNPLIANAFYLAGFIERWGSGTERMVQLCMEQGLPEPEYKEEFGGFSVYFYKDIYTEENLRKMGLNERQIRAVMYVKQKGKITNKEYQMINGIKERMATLELNQLVERGIFRRVGTTGKGTFYAIAKE
ncbi:MAG: ATP-binding protein [Candidatus Calescibacterium sp.]